MMLELRAICQTEPTRTSLPGGYGVVKAGGLVGLVEQTAAISDLTSPLFLQRYQTALQACWQNGQHSILPVRGGTILPDPLAVGRLLLARAEEFTARLAYLQGKSEISVHFMPPEASNSQATPKAASGLEHMRQLQQKYTQQKEWQAQLVAAIKILAEIAPEYQQEKTAASRKFERVAFLVANRQLPTFRQAVQNCGLAAIMLDPMPPFSFVQG